MVGGTTQGIKEMLEFQESLELLAIYICLYIEIFTCAAMTNPYKKGLNYWVFPYSTDDAHTFKGEIYLESLRRNNSLVRKLLS